MSTGDVVFNGNSFVDNLNLVLRKVTVGITDSDLDSRKYMDTTFSGKTAAGFLSTISTGTNPFTDWAGFLQAWKNYSGDTSATGLLDAFVKDFKKQVGYTDGNPANSDWGILSETIQGSGNGVVDATMQTYFINSFSSFVGNYPYIQNSSPPPSQIVGDSSTAGDNFFTNWTKFMTRTANFDDSTSPGPSDPGTYQTVDMAAYEQVYASFFPPEGETPAQLQARYAAKLKQFFDDQVKTNGGGSASNGYFIPSQSFHTWFEDLRNEFVHDASKTSLSIRTTASSDTAHRILVIDRILRLLIDMVGVLQRISAAQAQRLSFLTTWQDVYTNEVTDVPQYAAGDGSPIGGSGKAAKAFRNNDVNPHMQAILEKVKARRSNVQDEAKAMQTTINQTQDAANQQTQMATSLLQELSTILGQIFR